MELFEVIIGTDEGLIWQGAFSVIERDPEEQITVLDRFTMIVQMPTLSKTEPKGQPKLKLTVVEAKLTHNTELIGKMDPYCKITCRDQSF